MPRTLALEYSHNNVGRGWGGSEKVSGIMWKGLDSGRGKLSTIGIAGQGADLEGIVFGEETDYRTALIALLLDYLVLVSLPVAPVTAIIGLVDI